MKSDKAWDGGPTVAEAARLAGLAWKRRARLAQIRDYNRRIRREALAAYGARCQCPGGCRIRNERWLVIDHVDGAAHSRYRDVPRTGTRLFHWLRREGYPAGFRVLCVNCNHALGHYHRCPHQDRLRSRLSRP